MPFGLVPKIFDSIDVVLLQTQKNAALSGIQITKLRQVIMYSISLVNYL